MTTPIYPQCRPPARTLLVVVASVLATILLVGGEAPAHAGTCSIDATPVTTVASQSECDALIALYNSTDGLNWKTNTGWNTPTDPCGWHGVRCDSIGVVELHLHGHWLTGPIPIELWNLTHLSVLSLGGDDLNHNHLSGSLPAEIGNLTNLTGLSLGGDEMFGLGGNELTGPIPPEIGNLTNLEWLGLIGNELTGPIPPEIGNLTNLDWLGTWGNHLSSVPAEIGNLTDLIYLSLHANDISALPAEIGNLANLTELSLDNNHLSGDITVPMRGVHEAVQHLYLSDGPGGNNCLSVSDAALATSLTALDQDWNECELMAGTDSVVIYDPLSDRTSVVDVVDPGVGFTISTPSAIVEDADTVGAAFLGGPHAFADDVLFYSSATGRFQFMWVTPPDPYGHRGLHEFVDVTGTRGWTHVVPGDYNGDGATDVLFYRARDGLMRFYTTTPTGRFIPITPVMHGNRGWTHIVAGDYDGDGSDDVLWYRASDGLIRFYEVTATGTFRPITPVYHGMMNWTTIPAGDYNGDGADDVLWYREDGVARFYEVTATGTFRALGAPFYPTPGFTQIESAELTPDTTSADLIWYHAGKDLLLATRYNVNGVTSLWRAQSTAAYGDTLILATGYFPR